MATTTKRKREELCLESVKKSRISEEQVMVQRLSQIHHALVLEHLPVAAVTKDINSFNQEYQLKSTMMEKATECAHEVIVPVMRAIRSHEHDQDQVQQEFRTEGYFMLGLLARNDLGRQAILNEGGFSLLIHHLKLSKQEDTGFTSCCYALGNLLTSNQVNIAESCQLVRSEQIVSFVLNQLRERLENWKLAQQIFFSMANMAFISDFESEMLENGAIELAVRALRLHSQRVSMVVDAVFFLKNLAFGEKGRLEILRQDAILPLLNVLANNVDNSELVEITLNLFFSLTFSGAIPILTKNSLPICLFITLIKHHRFNALPLKECIRTMVRIYLHSTSSVRVTIVQEGFIDCLMHLYTLYQPFLIQNEENGKESNIWKYAVSDKQRAPSSLIATSFVDTNDETNLELFFQIETAFKKIVLLPLPVFEHIPSEPPPLQELAIRAVKRYSAAKEFDVSRDDPSIPEDVHSQLSFCKECDFCHHPYHSNEYNLIYPGPSPLALLVPVYWRLCSEQCLAAVRARKKSLPDHSLKM